MRTFLLFLTILIPSIAFPQTVYDLSCDNIAQIQIIRLRTADWFIEHNSGYYHLLVLDLKPQAARAFGKLLKSISAVELKYNNVKVHSKTLIITANGGYLQSDIPAMNGFSEQGATIPIFLKKDAFDAARAVCPALVPTGITTYGQ